MADFATAILLPETEGWSIQLSSRDTSQRTWTICNLPTHPRKGREESRVYPRSGHLLCPFFQECVYTGRKKEVIMKEICPPFQNGVLLFGFLYLDSEVLSSSTERSVSVCYILLYTHGLPPGMATVGTQETSVWRTGSEWLQPWPLSSCSSNTPTKSRTLWWRHSHPRWPAMAFPFVSTDKFFIFQNPA